MYIKKATLSDIKQISDSVYEAFKEYELFAIKASNQSKESVLKELFKLNTIAYIQKDSCYVCIENEKLVGTFNLIDLRNRSIGISDFLKAGALKALFQMNILTIGQIMNRLIKADSALKDYGKDYYYLDTLVISPQHQGNGLGSKIIDYIKDLIESESEKVDLRLITNSDINAMFYTKNGFVVTKKSSFDVLDQRITTWSFLYQTSQL